MKKWQLEVIGSLICLFILYIVFYKSMEYKNLDKTGVRGIGIIEVVKRYIFWNYEVNGTSYSLKIDKSDYPFVITGEKYNLYYEKEDPANSRLKFTEPIIEKDSFFAWKTLPLSFKFEEGSNVISFKYSINNDTLTRQHKVYFPKKIEVENVELPIWIKSNNPRISYFVFDEYFK